MASILTVNRLLTRAPRSLLAFRAGFLVLAITLSGGGHLFGQAAQTTQPLPMGFRGITLGMGLEQVKEALKADPLFRYRGDPDVSFLPQTSQYLIECEGASYLRRAYFQFADSRLFIMILVLDTQKLDHYGMWSALAAKYGQPTSLSPDESVWQSDPVRFSLERPLTVKYIDNTTFAAILAKGGAQKDLDQVSQEKFIEQFIAPKPRIVLKPGRDGPARKRHHPWIYSQAVAEYHPSDSPADPLPVRSADGVTIGWGLHSADSLIAVRMICFTAEPPATDWIATRLRDAKALRDSLSLDSDAYRLVNAEGDFIPGLVVDVYGDTVVVSPHTLGAESSLPQIVSGLREIYPAARIYLRRDEHFARVEKLGAASGYLHGAGEGTSVIREGAVRLIVDCAHGQKTGYYLDQRENRALIARHASGRRVLNLFSYTGCVALRAASAGAAHVVSVDSSKRALELAAQSAALNPGVPVEALEWVAADVFDFLAQPLSFDLVVADPPPFARRRSELDGALKGYTSLFQQCLRLLSPGGVAFLFSCSGAVDRTLFQQVVMEAGLRCGRPTRILRELHADADHPVAATHPEGEYLKGLMLHVQ